MKTKFKLVIISVILFQSISILSKSQNLLKERLEKHVYTLADDSLRGRKAKYGDNIKAANYIISQFEEIGIEPYNGNVYEQPFYNIYKNIIGILPGNDPILKDEYILVGAHYDHLGYKVINRDTIIYNGADDNASGVAAMLEVSRNLKEVQASLKRSVIFVAFDAEEIGLVGSDYFVENPIVPLNKIKHMFSVDMVGWYKKSGYVKYIGVGCVDKDSENNIFANNDLIPDGLNIKLKDFETSILTGTDTEGFLKRGIPAVHVFTGLKSPYHKPGDDAHLIDYDGMALITEHLTNIVKELSIYDDISISKKMVKKYVYDFKKFNIGISVNAGSNRHYYTAGPIDGKKTDSYGVGITSQFNLNKVMAIRPEVYYEYIQGEHPGGRIITDNITIPLSLVLQSSSKNVVGVDIFIGGYYNYKFRGKQGGENLNFTDSYYRNEGGLNYGIGFRLSKLKFGCTGRYGLTNFTRSKNDDGAYICNRANYFTLTYMF